MSTTRPSTSSVDAFTTARPITWCQKYWPAGSATASSRRIVTSLPRSVSAAFRSATSVSFRRMWWGGCDRVGLIDERPCNVFNQTFQIGFEVFEVVVLVLLVFGLLGFGVDRRRLLSHW